MAFNYGCLILQRVVLPTVLVLSALYRPVGISFVYLLMFFVSPFIPVATKNNFKGSIPAYLLLLIALSSILLLCHAALTVALVALNANLSDGCNFTAQILRHIGFVDFSGLAFLAIVEWCAAEVLVFLTSLIVYFVVKRLTIVPQESQLENGEIGVAQTDNSNNATTNIEVNATLATPGGSISIPATRQLSGIGPYLSLTRFNKIGPFFSCVTLFFAAVLRPSIPGGFYFIMFLLTGSYWASYKPFKRGFTLILRLVMFVMVLHVLSVVAYQTYWIQDHLNKDGLLARLISLEPLILSSCEKDLRIITYNKDYKLDSFLSPIALLLAYYTLAVTDKELKRPRIAETQHATAFGQHLENSNHKINRQLSLITQTSRGSKKDSKIKKQRLSVSLRREPHPTASEPSERTPLVRDFHHKPRTKSESIAVATTNTNDIQLETLHDRRSQTEELEKASFCEQLSYGFLAVGGFIYQNSYIFTNILMMVWSIVYHSWLTFILLLWANVLWMIPNQRKAMMRSSPFVVMYAELLVIAQYIYGMNLSNEELPSSVATQGINLQQIGFERPQENGLQPCVPLIVKTSFLLMFWITLRQFCKEKREKKHRQTTIADIFAPLSAVGTGHGQFEAKKTSKFLKAAGEIIKNLLVRLWMWLLVLVIFLCAITGKNMTGFRIFYMALFLFFLLVFQSSSKAWVKIMYGFWLFLIFYAMSILTLIYTYQFDKFDQYWYSYLNISKTLQSDIGLERYRTKDLFLHLLSPTIIVILTVIQVHYFHKRFIASLQQQEFSKTTQTKTPSKKSSSEPHSSKSLTTTQPPDETEFKKSLFNLIKISVKKARTKLRSILKNFKSIFWRFLELHIIKAVYIAAFVCSASEVCFLHVLFLALCISGAISRTKAQTVISRVISFIVTIIVLLKMIYQITYLDHARYDVTCDFTNVTSNNALWIGLQKSSPETGGLMGLLKKYIIYMIIATLHAVVALRQRQMRHIMRQNNQVPPKVLFPNVERADAERDLKGLIQYVFNYGFYKFGLEISLIALVADITYRKDIISILYAICLFVLIWVGRTKCEKIWGFFQGFIAFSIFVQYLIYLALPPGWCIQYPWTTTPYSEALQQWALLPGDLHISHYSKLIFDFILLLIVVRQKRVFHIESKNPRYPGGDNKSVVEDIENLGSPDFNNPTFDFCSHTRNYSDIVKSIIMRGFFWFTLAVVFLAGTNISDILALGYLIGAFIFLWQGSDFYLRPIQTILKRWNWLLYYNIANILFKTCMQLGGCVFINTLRNHCCWLVHLLGITCGLTTKSWYRTDNEEPFGPDECPRTSTTMVLLWDAICFAFIILQMRIFKSHYFCHIIIDTKANSSLASRGAKLIEDLRQEQFQRRQAHEKQILSKIKRKMEKIRATQQQRPYDEFGPVPGARPLKKKEIKLHPEAVRAGDYYMFEDIDDKFELDMDMLENEDDLLEDNDNITESEIKMQRRKTLYDVWKDINCSDMHHDLYVRDRSYASAPGSSVGIKVDNDTDECEPSVMHSIHSEPLDLACYYSTSSIILTPTQKTVEPSTSKEAQKLFQREDTEKEQEGKLPERKANVEADSVDLTAKDSDEDIEANPIVRLMAAFLVSLTIRLNRFSRNYRYVNLNLTKEKKIIKGQMSQEPELSIAAMTRLCRKNIQSDDTVDADSAMASASSASLSNNSINIMQNNVPPTSSTSNDELINATTNTNTTTTTTPSTTQLPLVPQSTILQPQSPLSQDLNDQQHLDDITELPLDTIDARKSETSLPVVRSLQELPLESEEFAARDHNIIIEVIISAWYALLANTDLICYIVVFINQVTTASVITLPLPIMVFLWGTLSLPRPTKTFWVTLIAYTQAIVFIKCVFQYKLIWANYVNLPNQPLAPAKIFGVELNPNYAVYDLLLLFVLFFHRFILKSQGLWKSSYKERSCLQSAAGSETDDNIAKEQQQAISENELDRKSCSLSTPLHQIDDIDGKSISSESQVYIKGINKLKRAKYLSSLRKFFFNLEHKTRLATDVYALMFLCDFINFFVLLFGFTAFGSQAPDEGDDGGVQTYLSENKVPVPFLIMLLVQFLLIVIDRALYLRKALVHKIIFHFLSVIGIHIWMFFVVPLVTERSFYSLAPPIIFYIFKCFYMLLSSYQIKSGYPKRILGNFLTKGFSMVNMILFRVYMLIPLLYELRSVLDWVCTDTTMTIFDWLKMEDIFSNIYFIRCTRQMEKDFPAVRAQKKATYMKLFMGGTIILIIVFFIWGPLCIFALNKTVGQSNVPFEVSQSIRIGPYESIYSTTNRERIFVFDDAMYTQMRNVYIKKKSALSFLTSYDPTDVAAVKIAGNAPSLWNISPPDKQRFLDDLKNNRTLSARFSYTFDRKPPEKKATGHISSEVVYDLDANFTGREAMVRMLEGNATEETVMIPNIVPKFVKIINSGDLSIVNALLPNTSEEYRPLILKIHGDNNSLWWEIRDYCDDEASLNILNRLPLVDCNSGIIMYTFNDKMFPQTFSFLTAGGIIGVYTTIVLLASRVLRSFISEQYRKIMFQDLPYVDRVLQLCLDIYLVREAQEFALEEDLFAKLIFLYRSPETMIKWTRPKEEFIEEETDSESGRSRRP